MAQLTVIGAERELVRAINALAATQRSMAEAGCFPLQQDWVGIDAELRQRRNKSRLRVAGVRNLSTEVLAGVSSGASTPDEVRKHVELTTGAVISPAQIRRSLHALAVTGVVERTARGKYAMPAQHS